jgi:hypothetical protein
MVIDSYGLSPIQEGMLFQHVSGDQPGVDVEQTVIEYPEPLDVARRGRAWQLLVD